MGMGLPIISVYFAFNISFTVYRYNMRLRSPVIEQPDVSMHVSMCVGTFGSKPVQHMYTRLSVRVGTCEIQLGEMQRSSRLNLKSLPKLTREAAKWTASLNLWNHQKAWFSCGAGCFWSGSDFLQMHSTSEGDVKLKGCKLMLSPSIVLVRFGAVGKWKPWNYSFF